MMKDPQPIKRTEELAPLSRDHHNGLLLGWKIRQGLQNGTPVDQIGRYVQWFWDEHLKLHFRDEEELLFPVAPHSSLLQQMMEEHIAIRKQIEHGNWNEENLNNFADDLTAHIRFEERVLFPFIEKEASPEQMKSIAMHLQPKSKSSAAWEDEFWLKKN